MKINSKVHAIISDVYRLLGTYSATELDQASNYRGLAPNVRGAIRYLSAEASGDSLIPYAEHVKPNTSFKHGSPNTYESLTSISNAIRRNKRFSSTSAIIQFANELGITVEVRPKESRERLARRVAEGLLLLREPKKSQTIARLVAEQESQTQGWIETIKTSR